MDTTEKEKLTRLRRALSAAYFHRDSEGIEAADHLTWKIMADVRALIPAEINGMASRLFESLVWKFVPVACALTILLAIMAVRIKDHPGREIAYVLIQEASDSSLYALYNR